MRKDSVFEPFTCLKRSRRIVSLYTVLPSCKKELLNLQHYKACQWILKFTQWWRLIAFLGYDIVQSGRWLPFQWNLLPPSFRHKTEKVGFSEILDYTVPWATRPQSKCMTRATRSHKLPVTYSLSCLNLSKDGEQNPFTHSLTACFNKMFSFC